MKDFKRFTYKDHSIDNSALDSDLTPLLCQQTSRESWSTVSWDVGAELPARSKNGLLFKWQRLIGVRRQPEPIETEAVITHTLQRQEEREGKK